MLFQCNPEEFSFVPEHQDCSSQQELLTSPKRMTYFGASLSLFSFLLLCMNRSKKGKCDCWLAILAIKVAEAHTKTALIFQALTVVKHAPGCCTAMIPRWHNSIQQPSPHSQSSPEVALMQFVRIGPQQSYLPFTLNLTLRAAQREKNFHVFSLELLCYFTCCSFPQGSVLERTTPSCACLLVFHSRTKPQRKISLSKEQNSPL